jgi:protein-tyrosine-phosphatase
MSFPEDIIEKTKIAKTIYFVCSGNIIRSAFAELFARHLGLNNIASYGTTYQNTTIHQRSAIKLKELGVPENWINEFQPRHINSLDEFNDHDLHVIMTNKHHSDLLREGIRESQIVYITEYLGMKVNVEDPYFSNNYEEAYKTISEAVTQIIDILS